MATNDRYVATPGGLGDLVRMGGNPQIMDNVALKNRGAGMWSDLARAGGDVNPLAITGTPILVGTNGVAYVSWTATASGGVAPRTFSKTGTWPTGINVNATTGVVSGTPSQAGSFAGLSIKVTDSAGVPVEKSLPTFTLVIGA